jgi:hypothetical protein
MISKVGIGCGFLEAYAETKKLIGIYQKKLINLGELKKSVLQNTFNGESSKLPELIEAHT